MSENKSQIPLLQMIQISDSLFPIGAFTLSNGLETYVSQNRMEKESDLISYVNSYLKLLPYNDLGVMRLANSHANDLTYLCELDQLSMAYKAPQEVREGSRKLCSRFLKIWEKIQVYPVLDAYKKMIAEGTCVGNHGIAVGLYSHEIGLSPEDAAGIYGYGLLTAIVTNAVKTIPLSQVSGQKILHECIGQIEECVKESGDITLSDLGIGGTGFDLAAMQHETLYSRLYMS